MMVAVVVVVVVVIIMMMEVNRLRYYLVREGSCDVVESAGFPSSDE